MEKAENCECEEVINLECLPPGRAINMENLIYMK
jgi:hypothetical protein